MGDLNDEKPGTRSNDEKERRVIAYLFDRLKLLESNLHKITSSGVANSKDLPKEMQEMITKISDIRQLIDKIEVEISHLNSRISDIESLRFNHRTQS